MCIIIAFKCMREQVEAVTIANPDSLLDRWIFININVCDETNMKRIIIVDSKYDMASVKFGFCDC